MGSVRDLLGEIRGETPPAEFWRPQRSTPRPGLEPADEPPAAEPLVEPRVEPLAEPAAESSARDLPGGGVA
jgi:hypothetical protein